MNAAVDPARWPDTMNKLSVYGKATGAVILPLRGTYGNVPFSESIGEGLAVYLEDEWYLRDERRRGLPLLATRPVFTDQDFATEHELKHSEYYRGFLSKYQCNWSAVVGFTDPTDECCLVFERGDRGGFFDKNEQADLARFSQILNDATSLARQLSFANAAGALDAYQLMGNASFLLDRSGKVVRHNERAERLLGDGLELSRGQLRAPYAPDNPSLRNLIEASINGPVFARTSHEAVVHRADKRPLIVRAIPLTGQVSSIFSSASTILVVSDFEQPAAATPHGILADAFGLTPTEARLVSQLEKDVPLADAADEMRISLLTAKTHLKRILSKTDTKRQQDLLMLLRRRASHV